MNVSHCESIVRIALLMHSNGEVTQNNINNVFQVYADIMLISEIAMERAKSAIHLTPNGSWFF